LGCCLSRLLRHSDSHLLLPQFLVGDPQLFQRGLEDLDRILERRGSLRRHGARCTYCLHLLL
jgi:hypothetical protein